MKTADFKMTDSYGTIYGTVTLKDNGKMSVSLRDSRRHRLSTKYAAKKLAQQIVEANFEHEAVTSYKEQNSSKLAAVLTEKTEGLREKFVQENVNFAVVRFKAIAESIEWDITKWYDEYDIPWEMVTTPGYGRSLEPRPAVLRHDKKYYKMRKARDEAFRTFEKGQELFLSKAIDWAESHYLDSIAKLAQRVNQLGVHDDSEFEVKSAWLGRNFECYISHDRGTIKAWTIIASGPVQRPHYRFLVKST